MKTPSNNNVPAKTDVKAKEIEFVAVVILDDVSQANDYKQLLEVNDIQAYVVEGVDDGDGGSEGAAVMVPEDCLDEAHVVIESQDAYDDFYDMALDDELADLDDDMLDDEF